MRSGRHEALPKTPRREQGDVYTSHVSELSRETGGAKKPKQLSALVYYVEPLRTTIVHQNHYNASIHTLSMFTLARRGNLPYSPGPSNILPDTRLRASPTQLNLTGNLCVIHVSCTHRRPSLCTPCRKPVWRRLRTGAGTVYVGVRHQGDAATKTERCT